MQNRKVNSDLKSVWQSPKMEGKMIGCHKPVTEPIYILKCLSKLSIVIIYQAGKKNINVRYAAHKLQCLPRQNQKLTLNLYHIKQ